MTPRTSTPSRATTCRRPRSWPEFVFDAAELQYPARLNCAAELLDRRGRRAGSGDRVGVLALPTGALDLRASSSTRANRIAHVLVDDLRPRARATACCCAARTPR